MKACQAGAEHGGVEAGAEQGPAAAVGGELVAMAARKTADETLAMKATQIVGHLG